MGLTGSRPEGRSENAYKFLSFICGGGQIATTFLKNHWVAYGYSLFTSHEVIEAEHHHLDHQKEASGQATSTQSSRCQEAAFRWGSRKNITRRILSSQHSDGSSNRSTDARGSRGEGTCRSSCWLRKKDDCVSKNVSVIQGEEHDNTHQSTWFTALTNCRANSSAWKEVCPWKDNSLLELRVSQLAVVD